MSKFFTIFKQEYAQVVKKKSFIIGIFLTPILMAAFMLVPAMLATSEPSRPETVVVLDHGGEGIGRAFARSLTRYTLEQGTDTVPAYDVEHVVELPPMDVSRARELEDSLATAIAEKQIKYLVVLGPTPYLNDSSVYVVTNSDNFRTLRRFESRLTDIFSSRRLEESRVNLGVDSVLTLTRRLDLATRDTTGESIPFEVKYFGALIIIMIIYAMILTYGATLMRSVIEEKNSRIVEVLVSSVTPFQLMLGKVMGLGAAAFTTVVIWVAAGAAIMLSTGISGVEIDPAISRLVFNPVIVVFFVLFLTAGYLLYSTFFALIGSIVNSDKEAQHFIMPIVLFLLFPVFVGIVAVQDPYATWLQVLSYIPLFSPTLMMMRIIFIAPTATDYSLFSGIVAEGALAFIILIAGLLAMVWVTGRIFRVGILMTGKRPTLPEIIKWVKHA